MFILDLFLPTGRISKTQLKVRLVVLSGILLFLKAVLNDFRRSPNVSFVSVFLIGLTVAALLAAHVKRLHDIGRGPLPLLWFFVPLYGWHRLRILLYRTTGDSDENPYGKPNASTLEEVENDRLKRQLIANDGIVL